MTEWVKYGIVKLEIGKIMPSDRKILCVEDDPDMAEMYSLLLQSSGFQVDIFTSADEGWAALGRGIDPSTIVLTDYNTPGYKNGADLALHAHRCGFSTALMTTAFDTMDYDHERDLNRAGVMIINKTLGLTALLTYINSLR